MHALLIIAVMSGVQQDITHPDLSSKPAFTEWVHDVLALDYVPAIADRAKAPERKAFLAALADPGGRDPMGATVTAALRMWIAAQRTDDPEALRAFAKQTFADPASY